MAHTGNDSFDRVCCSVSPDVYICPELRQWLSRISICIASVYVVLPFHVILRIIWLYSLSPTYSCVSVNVRSSIFRHAIDRFYLPVYFCSPGLIETDTHTCRMVFLGLLAWVIDAPAVLQLLIVSVLVVFIFDTGTQTSKVLPTPGSRFGARSCLKETDPGYCSNSHLSYSSRTYRRRDWRSSNLSICGFPCHSVIDQRPSMCSSYKVLWGRFCCMTQKYNRWGQTIWEDFRCLDAVIFVVPVEFFSRTSQQLGYCDGFKV